MTKIDKILKTVPIISTMVNKDHIRIILNALKSVARVNGDVVEFGCNVGTTSIFLQSYLIGSSRTYRVYDSFEGFPDKLQQDEGAEYHFMFEKGGCKTSIEVFTETFEKQDLPLPFINKGWFKDVQDKDLPDKIAFAFFDSDFYSSIYDSWTKAYPRLTKGAKVCIHDYGWDVLPGCKLACDDFLSDKPENGTVIFDNFIGIFTKM